MEIKITVENDYSGYPAEDMVITDRNNTHTLYVHSLCETPEDAIIGRDLISCQEIASLMKLAHAAGSRGEVFNLAVVNSPQT